jgi:hypothetical protein
VTPPFYDHSTGTNATANGAGVEAASAPAYQAALAANNVAQNSWRYTFYDGAPFFFNANTIGRYDVRLTAFQGVNVVAQVTAQFKVVESATCFIDSECDDGLGCNGVETCNPDTNLCEFGTEVDCSGLDDQCNVGTCVDPAGTCTATPVVDGSACDDGDTCSLSDSCQAGACDAGGGGDTDFDGTCDADDLCPVNAPKLAPGICGCAVADTDTDSDLTPDCNDLCPVNAPKVAPGQCGCAVADTDTDSDLTADCNDLCPVNAPKIAPGQCGCAVADTDTDSDLTADCNDNCPVDANPDQADIDEDGLGNVCDDDDATGTLVVSRARVRAANVDSGAPGSVSVNAIVIDELAGGTLAADLAFGNVSLEVESGAFTTTAGVGVCTAGGSGRFKCNNTLTGVKATFTPLIQGENNVPDLWKLRLKQRGIASTGSPAAPVVVTLVQPTPAISRGDEISSCEAKPGKLSCRED